MIERKSKGRREGERRGIMIERKSEGGREGGREGDIGKERV